MRVDKSRLTSSFLVQIFDLSKYKIKDHTHTKNKNKYSFISPRLLLDTLILKRASYSSGKYETSYSHLPLSPKTRK